MTTAGIVTIDVRVFSRPWKKTQRRAAFRPKNVWHIPVKPKVAEHRLPGASGWVGSACGKSSREYRALHGPRCRE